MALPLKHNSVSAWTIFYDSCSQTSWLALLLIVLISRPHKKGFNITFTLEDILSYIGMNIAMGVVDLPEITDYWTREPILQSPWFPSVMSLKRFKAILHFLHFADNTAAPSHDDPSYDRLWKIRPVIKSVGLQAQCSYSLGEHVSVDESMIGTKGRQAFFYSVYAEETNKVSMGMLRTQNWIHTQVPSVYW